MALTGNLSSTPKPHGLMQRNLQWIHPPYLASFVLIPRCLENLPVNVVVTPQVKKTNSRPQASYGPKSSYRQRTHLSCTNANVLQGNLTQAYEYERVSSNCHVHKTKNYSAYSYEYYSPPARLFARAPKPKFSDATLRLIVSKPPLKMWVVKKN